MESSVTEEQLCSWVGVIKKASWFSSVGSTKNIANWDAQLAFLQFEI